MQAKIEFGTMTRRAFTKLLALATGAGVARTYAAAGSSHALASTTRTLPVYVFSPREHDKPACKACRRHAEHKRFATREAAEQHRAHPGCNCTLIALAVSEADYMMMFGSLDGSVQRAVFDQRWATPPSSG